jgi:hypothetical protein|tara:strand:- start:256 stop:717 length:462 start_codon:yes stop_codon:yes gene_type:complete
MAIANSYPVGTPKSNDLLLGTSVPAANSDDTATTKNFSISDVSSLATLGHKVYAAALLQTSTSAPVATVLQNTTGGTFTWTYVSPGKYLIAVSGITLPANKVAIFMSNWTGRFSLGGQIVTTTKIEVEQFNQGSGAYIDDIKAGASVEIRIYS